MAIKIRVRNTQTGATREVTVEDGVPYVVQPGDEIVVVGGGAFRGAQAVGGNYVIELASGEKLILQGFYSLISDGDPANDPSVTTADGKKIAEWRQKKFSHKFYH